MELLDINTVESIALYTGDYGFDKCLCKCPNCNEKNKNGDYQGNIDQVYELLNKFKNLKQIHLIGNPDPFVDVDFCNEISKICINYNIKVAYSTVAVGGIDKLKKLLNNIEPSMVDYISFCIDSIDSKKMSEIKGIKYPFYEIVSEIRWAIKKGYKVNIHPTLWKENYMDSYDIIDFFSKLGVDWYVFQIGMVEKDCNGIDCRLNEQEIKQVHNDISRAVEKNGVKVSCPVIYKSCGENDESKYFCFHPKDNHNWVAYLKEDGIYITNLPLLAEKNNKYIHKLNDKIYVDNIQKKDFCPIENNGVKTLCRFITKKWN